VHIHGIGPAFFTPLARLLGFRVIVTHHAPDYERPKWSRRGRAFLKIGERMAGYFANRVICVSHAQLTAFLQKVPVAARRSLVIRHAGGVEHIDQPDTSDILDKLRVTPGKYLLAVGRLEATKGFHDLVQAFERADLGDTKLVIVGSEAGNLEYATRLRESASERIVFAGYRSGAELLRLYRDAALFVHPSYMEGFSLVVSEALAVGTPMLVSDIPPHREFGLERACYVPAGEIDALVEALRAPDFEVYRSPAARRRQQMTNWTTVAQQHIEVIRSAAGRRFSRPGSVARKPL
jgi:glycosyltransferase involved in cell wall biosynthesis